MAKIDYMTCEEVAKELGCKPANLLTQAKARPELLGFPVCVYGSTIRVPRAGFDAWKTGVVGKTKTDTFFRTIVETVVVVLDRLGLWEESKAA